MDDIYYNPEKYGLEIFDILEKEPYYNFDMIVVWEDKEGKLFYAQDSGCSCPSPFEYIGIPDLNHLSLNNIKDFEKELKEWNDYDPILPTKIHNLIKKVKTHLNNR